MSEAQSIFDNFNEIELTNDDNNLVKLCRDFIKESKEFTDYLIIEDERNKNNVRWYSSKDLFVSGMTMLIIHQELIERTIQEYKERNGNTSVIKNIESMHRKLIAHNEKTIRPYEYLIDFIECQKRILGDEV
ncbi:hypothetical protein OAM46_03195 [Gammaproteobacteria bacterium]|nr:hypothetical protein [Gammaproteobacteria bacterium]